MDDLSTIEYKVRPWGWSAFHPDYAGSHDLVNEGKGRTSAEALEDLFNRRFEATHPQAAQTRGRE